MQQELSAQEVMKEVKIKNGDKPKNTTFDIKEIDGRKVFCELSSEMPRPYIPSQLRQQVMLSLHSLDHLGIKASIKRIAAEFYWPALKHDVEDFCRKCNTCMKVKAGKTLTNTGKFSVPDKRFSHVMVDLVGPLPDSYGYKYLLMAICRTTRYLTAIPIREASSTAAAHGFLHGWLAMFGVPSTISSDAGGSFTAALWKEMMAKLNVDIKYSALYRPQSIGILERQHRSLKDSLKASIEDMKLNYPTTS